MSSKSKRRPGVIDALNNCGDLSRFTDANLQTLHLYAWITVIQCNEEIARRGIAFHSAYSGDWGPRIKEAAVP
jgi:hypothetical protein